MRYRWYFSVKLNFSKEILRIVALSLIKICAMWERIEGSNFSDISIYGINQSGRIVIKSSIEDIDIATISRATPTALIYRRERTIIQAEISLNAESGSCSRICVVDESFQSTLLLPKRINREANQASSCTFSLGCQRTSGYRSLPPVYHLVVSLLWYIEKSLAAIDFNWRYSLKTWRVAL